jgi:hypothetical protein
MYERALAETDVETSQAASALDGAARANRAQAAAPVAKTF